MSQSNLHLFTGDNAYALSLELRRWKDAFREKHGVENLVELDAQKTVFSELLDAISSMPFIAEKRLVILDGIPRVEREDLGKILESLHPQTVLLVVAPKPDKRLGIVKDFEKAAKHQTFGPLPAAELVSWLHAEAKKRGSVLSSDAASELLDEVGDDQWMLEGEIRKLCLFAEGREITRDMVRLLSVPSGSRVIWKLTDLIGRGRAEEALAFLRWQLARGEDVYGFWTILLNMIKNLALVWAHVDEGVRSEREIASSAGMHFLSVRNLLPLANSFDRPRMRRLIEWAAESDIALKTGGYRYSAERPEEVVALAEQAILRCRATETKSEK